VIVLSTRWQVVGTIGIAQEIGGQDI
jgi:hypothetical protein